MVDGYLLPKGSILFLNVWGVHHDEKRFPNPDVFDPDHFRGQTSLAAEYANIADPDGRDHYGYGMFDLYTCTTLPRRSSDTSSE